MTRFKTAVFVCLGTLLAACSDGGTTNDAGPDVVITTDGGGKDAGPDATTDSGLDATVDAPADASDGSVLTNPTSIQIEAVRNAAASTTDGGVPSLPIDKAIVTYTKALVGTEPAGFFVQAEKTGPALFVAVDPQTLSPVPVQGDEVSFVVTGATVSSGVHMATAIATFTRSAQGLDVSSLLQDVTSATDLVTNVDGYESEYITAHFTTKTAFATVSTGFVQAQIETTGLTGNAALNLRLRVPQTVKTSLFIDASCSGTLTGAMWRFGGVAQLSGWQTADVTSLVCAAPKVKSALATSDTSVVVTFDRDLAVSSLATDGSQFTFDNGLVASAASLTATNQVTVTTATQAANTTYKVTVASSLQDLLGKGIDTNANQASFTSYSSVATLQLNEINPNVSSSLDLIELLALTSGNVNGITVEQDITNATVLAKLPNIAVSQGDLIVVHLGTNTATTETTTKGDCTDASCYAGAWDVVGGTTGITYSGRVLVVRAPNANIQDGAAFYTGTPPSAFYQNVMSLQSAGAWLPADCSGNPCNSNTLAETVSVLWTGCGSTASGSSVARKANADTNYAADWAVGSSSFGTSNP